MRRHIAPCIDTRTRRPAAGRLAIGIGKGATARCERIDASDAGLPYFAAFLADLRDRSETAMAQSHVFTVMQLALRAQAMAEA